MVVPWVSKYSPAVPELHIASQITWLGGCFAVDLCISQQIFSIVAFSHADYALKTVAQAIHQRVKLSPND